MRPHRQLLGQSPRPSTLIGAASLPHEAALAQQLGRHVAIPASNTSASVSRFTTAYSTRNGLLKPALRHAAMQRHLAALEAALEAEARARLGALVPARRRLAVARSRPAADALFLMLGALGGTQVVQGHR